MYKLLRIAVSFINAVIVVAVVVVDNDISIHEFLNLIKRIKKYIKNSSEISSKSNKKKNEKKKRIK